MQVNIKNGQHNHKVIVADNILLCTFIELRSIYKQGSTLHVLCSDVCCIACWDNSPKAYSKSSVLGLACESTFWLTPSLPHCLSWLCMLSVLSANLGKTIDTIVSMGRLFFLSPKSPVITEITITQLSVKFANFITEV